MICWRGKQGDRETGTPQWYGTGGLTVKQVILGQGRVTCSPSAGLSYIHEVAVHVWDLMVSGLGYINAHVLGTDLMGLIGKKGRWNSRGWWGFHSLDSSTATLEHARNRRSIVTARIDVVELKIVSRLLSLQLWHAG